MSGNDNQQRFESLFRSAGASLKEVKAFGSRLIVTCHSQGAADKIANLLSRGKFSVDKVGESFDYDKVNRGTVLRPSTVQVWKVWAHA